MDGQRTDKDDRTDEQMTDDGETGEGTDARTGDEDGDDGADAT